MSKDMDIHIKSHPQRKTTPPCGTKNIRNSIILPKFTLIALIIYELTTKFLPKIMPKLCSFFPLHR